MKALIEFPSTQAIIKLIPETPDDEKQIKALAEKSIRTHNFTCRGFQYLESTVEFLIQPFATGRD